MCSATLNLSSRSTDGISLKRRRFEWATIEKHLVRGRRNVPDLTNGGFQTGDCLRHKRLTRNPQDNTANARRGAEQAKGVGRPTPEQLPAPLVKR